MELTAEQQAQVEQRNKCSRAAAFAADAVILRDRETAEAIRAMPGASQTRIAIEAALGYLIGHGLIEVKADWPEWLPVEALPHMQPDIDSMIAEDRRLRAAVIARLCIAIEVGRAEERQPVVLAESADGDLLADPKSGSVIMPNDW